ncbi:hypothetical protein G6F46_015323 [Rhizopus delemar]|nr:hypothetical protein G6F46_015323 [Rhizopus delemar]
MRGRSRRKGCRPATRRQREATAHYGSTPGVDALERRVVRFPEVVRVVVGLVLRGGAGARRGGALCGQGVGRRRRPGLRRARRGRGDPG